MCSDQVHAHTSCISEAEAYQGALYRGKKHSGTGNPGASKDSKTAVPAVAAAAAPAAASDSSKKRPLDGADEPHQFEDLSVVVRTVLGKV
jgi:hypothetical protein